jgi:hypothetical protein
MKLKTKVDVTCSEAGKVQPYTGKVLGELLVVVMFPQVRVNWEYQKEDGTPILSGVTEFTTEQADELLTTPITSIEVAKEVFYNAMKIEMASAFDIKTNQIESI